jgi:hypothetical protein
MLKSKKSIRFAFVGLAVLGLSLAGCGDDDENTVIETDEAFLRVLHLSPDAPAVDVFVNGEARAVQNLAYLEGTQYLTVDAGRYTFNISATGSAAADSVLDIENIDLAKDKYYTAIAYDELGSLKALAIEDDYSGLAAGNIRVRAIHTALAVGQVDIWNLPETGDPALLYENVDFGVAGNSFDLPAGAYTLGFDVDDDANPDVVFELPELAAGTFANVFAVSDNAVFLTAQFRNGTLAQIQAKQMEPDIAEIRVLHLSPDAPAVDVWVNNSLKAVSELAFAEGTSYLELEADSYDFQIAPANTSASDSVLNIDGLELMKDKNYTAVAYDGLDNIQALALVDDYDGLDADNIRVRAVHTAALVGQVDIWALFDSADPVLLYENVDFGVAGNSLDLAADAYTLGFDVNDDAVPDAIFSLPSLSAGTVANLFAVNDTDDSLFLLAQFGDGSLARIDAD